MIITFRIQYRTTWGENLCVCINEENIVKLFTVDGYHWQGQTDYHPNPSVSFITYRYEVHREGRCIRKEFGIFPHQFYLPAGDDTHYLIQDNWRDLPAASYRFSSAFCPMTSHCSESFPQASSNTRIIFRALYPMNGKEERILGITGNCNTLGKWTQRLATDSRWRHTPS